MLKSNETKAAIKLVNKYAEEYYHLLDQTNKIKLENENLRMNLEINKEMLQHFIQGGLSITNDKKMYFINKLIEENTHLTKENFKLSEDKAQMQLSSTHKETQMTERWEKLSTKLFFLENELIIKENQLQMNQRKTPNGETDVFVCEPTRSINFINGELAEYKEYTGKLFEEIVQLKHAKEKGAKQITQLEAECEKYKKQLLLAQTNTDIKNSKSNCKTESDSISVISGKRLNRSTNYIKVKANLDLIKTYTDHEEYNQREIEIPNLTEEWKEVLKYSNMSQEEFLKFSKNKSAQKLCDAIEFLYKYILDKNEQINLLTNENKNLNTNNIKLNKENILLVAEIEEIKRVKDNICVNSGNNSFCSEQITTRRLGETGTDATYEQNQHKTKDCKVKQKDMNLNNISFESITSLDFRKGIVSNNSNN